MNDDVAGPRAASAIPVHLFREILLVPFAIEWHEDRKKRAIGHKLMKAAADALATGPWSPVDDRLLHMRSDRSADAADPERRAATLAPAYEEFVFFEPYVQRFLYGRSAGGKGRPPMRLFARDDVEGLEIGLSAEESPPDDTARSTECGDDGAGLLRFHFHVRRCNFYLFDTGNALLVVEIEHDSEAGSTPLTLAHAQRLLENVRRVFPPYFMATMDGSGLEASYFPTSFRWRLAGGDGDAQPHGMPTAGAMIEQVLGPADAPRGKARHPPMSEPWRALLEPLHVEGYAPETDGRPQVVLGQTGDDRAFVLAQIGVPHPEWIARSDWVRLCFADGPGDGFPYGQGFLEEFERRHCYDRFWDDDPTEDEKKLRYLVCGYAMVAVGQYDGTTGPRALFFRATLSKHLQRHYFQLVLIGCFQKAALLTLSERLALALEAEDDGSPRFRDAVHAMARESRHFTHRYWFEDISAQLQAGELFSLLRDHLHTRALYDQVVSELGEADRSLIAEEQGEVADQQERLSVIAGVGLVLAVTVGIFGMNIFAPGEELFGSVKPWQMFASGAGTGFVFCVIGLLWRCRLARAVSRWIVPIGLAGATIAAILFGAYAT